MLAGRHTLCPKNVHLFIFLNNSVKNWPILIIFGTLNPEKIWHEHLTDLSTSPVTCSHCTFRTKSVQWSFSDANLALQLMASLNAWALNTEISLWLDVTFHLNFCNLTMFFSFPWHFDALWIQWARQDSPLHYFYWCLWTPWFYHDFSKIF